MDKMVKADIFKRDLFEPALAAFRRIMVVPYQMAFNTRVYCNNCLPESFQQYNPDFNEWFDKLWKDIYPEGVINSKRYNKIKQYGNLLLAQPTGGFQIGKMNKQKMIDQYRKAVSGDKPVLMVITEPFQEDFVKGSDLRYQCLSTIDTQVGILTNDAFNELYNVTQGENSGLARVAVLNVTPKGGGTPITIANWHGDSKGINIDAFDSLVKWAINSGIHCITGDSNITVGKTKKSIFDKLSELSYVFACSVNSIEKPRFTNSIILNNQTEKGNSVPEVDGMFVMNLTPGGYQGPVKGLTALKAFTDYDETNPILADHCVVSLDVGFIVKSASAARMDDPQIGIFSKPEWMNVDLGKFYEKHDLPYTQEWIKIYNNFIRAHPEYTDTNKPILSLLGGRTRRKSRRRRRTRHLR